jgi:hypothetical protein
MPARFDRSTGARGVGLNGSQITAALRFLDLTDINASHTAKLRGLVTSRRNDAPR